MNIEKGFLTQLSIGEISMDFSDDIFFETDKNRYLFSEMDCILEDNVYRYITEGAEFSVRYHKVEETAFIQREITARFERETTLLRVGTKAPQGEEGFLYETFYNASAAAFFRKGTMGVCCGFENPYCRLEDGWLFFEPSIILKAQETFVCDLNFYGVYGLTGEKMQPRLNRSQIQTNDRNHPRYRNPGEGIPLDFAEIQEFGKYTCQYFGCDKKEFKFMMYDFFGNLPQRPKNEEELNLYLKHIDTTAELGCDTILLNPLYPNEIPNESVDSCWELFPENTYADTILQYARDKGLKIGMYTGTAGNGRYGNSSMIGYAQVEQWKKIDVCGNISEENCLADDDFVDWYIQVQKNTIRKYNLDVWNWDPGPGHGFFCHSNKHGHLPGKGAYKGFRNSLKVMKALKDEFPNLYYQGFHGNKEYGLWGFKYIDQHEAFWENEVYVMNPVYEDLSVDRLTADNIRQQATWNYYFRFMPATMNHGIAHRMVQANWMGMLDLDLVFDHTGWKYALMSSIAYGGPITNTIAPRNPKEISEYLEFYKKWIPFAKEIFNLSSHTIPFGSQVGCGIDAVAKIKDNEGYLFLFNPFPKNHTFSFSFDKRIGCIEDGTTYHTEMIYPYGKSLNSYGYGDWAELVIPAYECLVLRVSSQKGEDNEDVVTKPLPRALKPSDAGIYPFYAFPEIKALLQRDVVTREALEVQKAYQERFNRVNDTWNRPDRLWLYVRAEDPSQGAKILVNDTEVSWQQDHLDHNELSVKDMVFADVTDAVMWDKENVIQLFEFDESAVYLHYPKPQCEELPKAGEPCEGKVIPALRLSDEVKVLSARMNEDNILVPQMENTLTAEVNLPAEELEGVYASVPISIGKTGNELKRDMTLVYEDGVWKKTFQSGERIHLIIDDEKIALWAVAKDGKLSRTYHLPIDWVLK